MTETRWTKLPHHPVLLEKRPPAVRLSIALTLIASVLHECDTSYRVCGECSLKHYNNLAERKQANKLEGVIKTLTKIVEDMDE